MPHLTKERQWGLLLENFDQNPFHKGSKKLCWERLPSVLPLADSSQSGTPILEPLNVSLKPSFLGWHDESGTGSRARPFSSQIKASDGNQNSPMSSFRNSRNQNGEVVEDEVIPEK